MKKQIRRQNSAYSKKKIWVTNSNLTSPLVLFLFISLIPQFNAKAQEICEYLYPDSAKKIIVFNYPSTDHALFKIPLKIKLDTVLKNINTVQVKYRRTDFSDTIPGVNDHQLNDKELFFYQHEITLEKKTSDYYFNDSIPLFFLGKANKKYDHPYTFQIELRVSDTVHNKDTLSSENNFDTTIIVSIRIEPKKEKNQSPLTVDEVRKVVNEEVKKVLENVDTVNLGTMFIPKSSFTKTVPCFYRKRKVKNLNSLNSTLKNQLDSIQQNCGKPCTKKNLKYWNSKAGFYKIIKLKSDTSEKRLIDAKIKLWEIVDSIKIHYVKIRIKDYAIDLIEVKTNNGLYTNNTYPIPLANFNKYNTLKLLNTEKSTKRFILLKDVLKFDKNLKNHYSPVEKTCRLFPHKDSNKYVIEEKIEVNSVINYNVFTDVLSLIGEESNGLVQLEFDSRIPLVSSPISGCKRKPFKSSGAYFLRYIQPYITLRRFDSKYRETPTYLSINNNDDGSVDSLNNLNHFQLYQRSWVRVGTDINIFHLRVAKHVDLDINMKTEFSFGKVRLQDSSVEDAGTSMLALEGLLHVQPLENFGFKLGYFVTPKPIGLRFIDRKNFINNKEKYVINCPSFMLYYNPVKDKFSRIFVRFNYYNAYGKSNISDFFQLQAGFRSRIKYRKD